MSEILPDTSRPDHGEAIRWRPWGAAAFEEATLLDRPVLLSLTAVWCAWSRRMDRETFADPAIAARVEEGAIPVRVDADRYPHVQDRYIAGGWPTNAFLAPTGEVLWAGTYVEPREFRMVMDQVLEAWEERRDELANEIERRRRALEASRSRNPALGLVRREAADDVLVAAEQTFDSRNGGFGETPKFPIPEAIEWLLTGKGADLTGRVMMAERTLDGMLAGEIRDEVEGGFYRYALEPDWTEPRNEKVLAVNAGQLGSYALGAHLLGRADWHAVAEETVQWVEGTLRRPDGLWGGSQAADEEYSRLDVDGRRGRPRPDVDPVVYTDANALWVRALVESGARLGREDWIERGAEAFGLLLDRMAAPGGMLYHFHSPDVDPAVDGLLVDTLEAARAALSLAQATGHAEYVEQARRLAEAMEQRLWSEKGGFNDHADPNGPGALRYLDRPFDRNASAARLFLDLALVTGERSYRAVAERTLAILSPLAGRYGVAAAEFALAVAEFFEAPLRIVLVGMPEETAELRRAALALPIPARRVWTLERGGQLGGVTFRPEPSPAAYVCGTRSCSPPIERADSLAAAVEAAR